MKWDIDKALAPLEPKSCPGTSLTRVVMDLATMREQKLVPTKRHIERGSAFVWCVTMGYSYGPKAFFFGLSIHEAVLNARKAAKAGTFPKNVPFSSDKVFQPVLKKPKPKEKKRRPKKKPDV